MQYLVYAVLSVCCTQCMLDKVYAIHSVCCTRCMPYSVLAELGVCCTSCLLCLVYAVLGVCWTLYQLIIIAWGDTERRLNFVIGDDPVVDDKVRDGDEDEINVADTSGHEK
jgi:hypothetical protein